MIVRYWWLFSHYQTKQGMGEEKKLIRYIIDMQENELRQVSSQFKSDYKRAKQQLKQVSY